MRCVLCQSSGCCTRHQCAITPQAAAAVGAINEGPSCSGKGMPAQPQAFCFRMSLSPSDSAMPCSADRAQFSEAAATRLADAAVFAFSMWQLLAALQQNMPDASNGRRVAVDMGGVTSPERRDFSTGVLCPKQSSLL